MIVLTPQEIESARLAIEDTLIERREARLSMMNRNGLCIFERDGTPSPSIRMSVPEAIMLAIETINAERANKA